MKFSHVGITFYAGTGIVRKETGLPPGDRRLQKAVVCKSSASPSRNLVTSASVLVSTVTLSLSLGVPTVAVAYRPPRRMSGLGFDRLFAFFSQR